MAEKKKTFMIISPKVRFVWPNFYEPKRYKEKGIEKGEPKYGATILFDADATFDDVKKTAAAAAMEAFGTTEGIRFPFKRGENEKAKAEERGYDGSFFEGKIVLKSNSQFQPQVVGKDRQPLLDTSKVHSGCYGFVELNMVAYTSSDGEDNDGNKLLKKGVTAYINFVMITDSGDRIAGRNAADVFKGIQGEETDFDPTASVDGLDDEIPF